MGHYGWDGPLVSARKHSRVRVTIPKPLLRITTAITHKPCTINGTTTKRKRAAEKTADALGGTRMLAVITAALSFASTPSSCRLNDVCDGCNEVTASGGYISFLQLSEFHSMWASEGFDLVIDVRSADSYAEGHIPDAVNMPGLATIEESEPLPRNLGACTELTVAVHCGAGYLSAAAGRILAARGFKNIFVLGESQDMLRGEDYEAHPCNVGFGDWIAAGYPLSTASSGEGPAQC